MADDAPFSGSFCRRLLRGRSLRRWLARRNILFAWAVLLVAAIHPPHGTGVSICWMHSFTDVPCPGCGLTRSVSCAVRGMWHESWEYHALGIALLAIFAAIAVFGVLPGRARRAAMRLMIRRAIAMHALYVTLIVSFIVYGAVRAIAAWLN